jgi:uncharacterized protein (TIGR00159 family)
MAIGPWDIVEFVLVWVLVYQLLLIIRGTRTVPMAVGLLVVFVVYQVTRWLELITLYTLLHTFLQSIVILAVIVFQEDIRRALVRVGRFARFSQVREAVVVDEVLRGATSLADRRIGALIVFEREAKLDDFFIEAGTEMDAAVNGDLLYAVFVPAFQNPVHDGAVVLRNFRIHRAGAFLPLTRNPSLDKALGTRHRAAIGITEETDAVAVVVSEERGTISLCYEGKIDAGLDPEALRASLLTLFAKPRQPGVEERQKKKKKSKNSDAVDDEAAVATADEAPSLVAEISARAERAAPARVATAKAKE